MATTGMKKDTLFKHKEVIVTCEENIKNANEYQKLFKPPIKQEKASKGKRIHVIYGQCNKSKHSKELCHWNPNNPNNKLKDKKEVVVNGVLAQPGDIGNKYNNKGNHGEVNKYGSIICHYFIYNFVKQKSYDYLYKDVVQVIFKEKAMVTTPKKDDVAINMVLAVTTHSHILENVVFKGKNLSRTKVWQIGKKRKSFNICLKKPFRTYNKRSHSKLVYKL
jgi:hypothetical protein